MKNPVAGSRGNIRGTLLAVIAVVLAVSLGFWLWLRALPPVRVTAPPHGPAAATPVPGGDPAQATAMLLKSLNLKLEGLDLLKLLDSEVVSRPATVNGKVFSTYLEFFRLPLRYEATDIASRLEAEAKALGARLVSPPVKTQDANGDVRYACSFVFGPGWTPVEVDFIQIQGPKFCLIIDDGGYKRGRALNLLLSFKVPVTLAIIPGAEFSTSLAQELPEHGIEIMCHMPMQGHEKGMVGNNYRELLKKGMLAREVEALLTRALDSLPHCRGLNNHMGSLATADPALMETVCRVLKDRDLYVIDSKTSAKSMVEKEARQEQLPFSHRDVFLDNVETPKAILKQLDLAVAHARRRGLVVAIAHFKLESLKVLQEAVGGLKDKGVKFVFASEIVK